MGQVFIEDSSIFTAAVENLLRMENAGAQWSMVSYQINKDVINIKKSKKNPGGRLDSTS